MARSSQIAAVLFFIAAVAAFVAVTVGAARGGAFNYPLFFAGLFLAAFGVMARRRTRKGDAP